MNIVIERQELAGRLKELIENKESFESWGYELEELFEISTKIEQAIEKSHLTCRIYSRGRLAVAAVGLFSFGAGLATLAGIAAHNLMTYNPDYEVCRDIANNRIIVEYKK